MNQVTPEQKDSVTKTFAIVGFVAVILFAVWLAVQIVSVIPSAFSSLASIADGVYNYNEDQTLTVASKNSVVNTGEAFTLSWTDMTRPGTYAFSYKCVEGTSADVRNAQGRIQALNCDTPLDLDTDTALDVIINSEKNRFTDVPYTVVFTPKNTSLDAIKAQSQVTIVNASIPTKVADQESAPEKTDTTTGTVVNESTTPQSTPVAPVATNNGGGNTGTTGVTAGTPTTIEEIIYAIPQSDPNGDVDLKVTYLGVGTLSDKTFARSATINRDKKGAFQFSVENIGTKTSGEWTFTALLPSGIEYTSKPQTALKPAEKAVITIGFEGLTQVGIEKFGVTLSAKNDVNKKNNAFTWAVEVVK